MNIRITSIFLVLLISCFTSANEEADDDVVVETVDESPSVDIPYETPKPLDLSKTYFYDHFDDPSQSEKQWIKSQAKKEDISEDIAKYDGEWQFEAPLKDALIGDGGLVLKSKAKHAAIAASLHKPFIFKDKPLVVQYEVILQDGQECGGSYLKLLSEGPDTEELSKFHDKTPYTIMFGPDKCGNDYKLHFIFKHRNPLNGSVEEKHCKKPKERLEDLISDKLPHLYTLVLYPDNTFEISIDKKVINSGSLLEDFTPPVNPPAEIDDAKDTKPEDWDEREKIPDPDAAKPEDWDEDAPAQIVDESAAMPDGWLEDEPVHIPDPSAKIPDDWDSEMDGEWSPPLIDNPKCAGAVGCGPWEPPLINNPAFKGKWRAPLIDNPNYKGKWRPRKIPNPDYFLDKDPFKMKTVSAVGFELWSMSQDIYFDNIIITEEIAIAEHWSKETFDKKRQKIAKDSGTLWGRMLKSMNYKPKTWGLYFIYCSIPLGIYIWYLYFNYQEESVIEKMAYLTSEYPILWAVYIIVLGIPVVFILYLCCKPSSSASQSQEKEELRKAAEKKKTDEATEDVKDEEEEEETTALEKDEVEEEQPDNDDREKNSGSDSEEEDNEKSEGSKVDAAEGARRRQVQKD